MMRLREMADYLESDCAIYRLISSGDFRSSLGLSRLQFQRSPARTAASRACALPKPFIAGEIKSHTPGETPGDFQPYWWNVPVLTAQRFCRREERRFPLQAA